MSVSINCRANRDFERKIDHTVTAAAVYYHKEADSFSDSGCTMLVTKHRVGPIKTLRTPLHTSLGWPWKAQSSHWGNKNLNGNCWSLRTSWLCPRWLSQCSLTEICNMGPLQNLWTCQTKFRHFALSLLQFFKKIPWRKYRLLWSAGCFLSK